MSKIEDIKISIVIPVYKIAESYLRCCIQSCIDQTYRKIEIILIDDGSPDSCGEICNSFADMDDRIKVVHQRNCGVSAARNVGIGIASGNWIMFVDADDWLELNACELVAKCITNKKSLDLIVFSMVKNYEHYCFNNERLYPGGKLFDTTGDICQLQRDVLEKQLNSNVLRLTFCKAIRTDILNQNAIRYNVDLPLCEDVVFWFEAILNVKSAYYIDNFLYHYRQVSSSATVRYRPNAEIELRMMLDNLKNLIESTPDPAIFHQGFLLEVFYSMQRCITQKYYHKDNTDSYFRRRRACYALFAGQPYQEALKNIPVASLTKNHRIKFYLLRLRLYGGVELLRKLFGRMTGRITG